MSARPYITLILPAFNEAARIGGTISESAAYFDSRGKTFEIIVAADGTDDTRKIVRDIGARDPRVRVIGQPERLGKGRGVREAVALSNGRFIGYADADNKVPIGEFDKFAPLLEAGVPVVVGSRALAQSAIERKQPLYRRLGSKGFHFFMQTVVGLPGLTDSQCGFKFFPANVAKAIFATQRIDGYMFDVEILALAIRLGLRIDQVPIRWRDDADSRLDLVRGNLQNVRDIFRIRLSLDSMAAAAAPLASSAAVKRQ
ncbi:MAG: glycosyltransferase family 2 protein [Acidobacteria bacterium]|nr:glycosyltransferase family 2 protein [Acidobacteriota bacterium]